MFYKGNRLVRVLQKNRTHTHTHIHIHTHTHTHIMGREKEIF